MVDIHTHILPGIDDGARNWEDSYRMAAIAADCGVDTIVCSHHCNIPGYYENYNSRRLDALFLEFQDRLKQGGFPLRIVRGMEIYSTPDVLEKMEDRRVLPINESDYYLLEFAFDETPRFIEETLEGVLRMGKKPILAHPERYYCLQDEPDILYYWMREGVLSQINRGSLQGRFGWACRDTAEQFMDHNLITCIASDAHRPTSRTTEMGIIYREISRHYSKEKAIELLDQNPRRIVEGKEIPAGDLLPFES